MHYPQTLAEHHLSLSFCYPHGYPGVLKGRHVSTGGCVSGFLLHTAVLWEIAGTTDCRAASGTVWWQYPRNVLESSQGSCLQGRQLAQAGDVRPQYCKAEGTRRVPQGTVALGTRQGLLPGCCLEGFPGCLPSRTATGMQMPRRDPQFPLVSLLRQKASCWLSFPVWCPCRRDRGLSVEQMMRTGSSWHRDHPQGTAPVAHQTSAALISSYHHSLPCPLQGGLEPHSLQGPIHPKSFCDYTHPFQYPQAGDVIFKGELEMLP